MSEDDYLVDGRPVLRQSALCFLDVLGVRDMSLAPEPLVTEHAVALHRALRRSAARYLEDEAFKDQLSVGWFTDNVVVSWPIPEGEWDSEYQLGTLLSFVAWFQADMALAGFWVRGGFAFGSACVTSTFAFGPALIEAVRLEKEALHPRVVLSSSAIKEVAEHVGSYMPQHLAPYGATLAVDDTEVVFVNYLPSVAEECDDEAEARAFLTSHRDRLSEALASASDASARVKLRWLAQYHNHYVETAFADAPDLALDRQLLLPRLQPMLDYL